MPVPHSLVKIALDTMRYRRFETGQETFRPDSLSCVQVQEK